MRARLGGRKSATALAAMIVALAAGAAGAARAQPSSASAGGFSAIQIATTDPEGLYREWAKPTPGVNLTTTTKVHRNQPITTFIIFKGCRTNAAGNCKVTVDFEVIDPTGKAYARHAGAEVWVDRPAPREGAFQLSVGGLGLGVEDKDPLGPYTVRATTTDHVAGIAVRTEQVLTAEAP